MNLTVSKERTYFGIIFLASILMSFYFSKWIPSGVDWLTAFRPAALELISGRSPYNIDGFFNPPWTLLPLIPLALLPAHVGRALLIPISLAAFGYLGYRLGGNKLSITAILLSPPLLHGILNSNIDWLALLGVVMPPQIGLFFVSTKPQIGVAIILFWLVESWRKGRFKEVLRTFWPFSLAILLSLMFYGPWPLRTTVEIGLWWNASLWPISLPVGLVLMVIAIRKQDLRYAMSASPCFSPYILFHSWIVVLYAIIRSTPETIAAVIGLWLLVIIRFLGI